MRTGNLFAAAIAGVGIVLSASGARADFNVTVGVGHMCCTKCTVAATAALKPVTDAVKIAGKTITITVKENDVVPALAALRASGFPPIHVDAGSAPITIAVGHLCCPHCESDLKAALTDAKISALDLDSMKIADGKLVVKAKSGQSLDLIAVTNAMEQGGFSATKITMGNAVAVNSPKAGAKIAKR